MDKNNFIEDKVIQETVQFLKDAGETGRHNLICGLLYGFPKEVTHAMDFLNGRVHSPLMSNENLYQQ